MTLLIEKDYGTPAVKSDRMVSVEIDGHAVSVPEGTSVMRAAAENKRVRAFGDGHSWSDIVANPDYLIDNTGLNRLLGVDAKAGTITVEAGMRLQQLHK